MRCLKMLMTTTDRRTGTTDACLYYTHNFQHSIFNTKSQSFVMLRYKEKMFIYKINIYISYPDKFHQKLSRSRHYTDRRMSRLYSDTSSFRDSCVWQRCYTRWYRCYTSHHPTHSYRNRRHQQDCRCPCWLQRSCTSAYSCLPMILGGKL